MSDLRELFLDELSDLYSAEKQLVKALPKMAKAATSDDLRQAFEEHLAQTEEHVSRLEQVFEAFDKPAKAKTCKAMQGLVEEGDQVIKDYKGEPACDAALICAAQKVEHYEIASYGTLCTWAEVLEQDDALELLQETLEEEKTTDERLTELAESASNMEAEAGEEEESESDQSEKPRSKRAQMPETAGGGRKR
jgi:ferritin-like metal-binding protein YciE